MNDSVNDPTGQDELRRFLEAIDEGTLADADLEHFQRRLSSDSEFRTHYLRLAALYGHLRLEGALSGGGSDGPEGPAVSAPGSASAPQRGGLAAGMVLSLAGALLIALVLLFRPSAQPPGAGGQSSRSTGGSGDSGATLIETGRLETPTRTASAARFSRSVNVRWGSEAHRWSVGDVLHEGDAVHLAEGRVELVFDSGAVMTLLGPAALDVHSAGLATLRTGTATTRVDHVESGEFKILTPAAEVLDLGTEFGVRVGADGEETEVVVFDGAVDLTPVANDTKIAAGRSPSRRLTVGEAVRVNRRGGWERVVSVDSDSFPFGDEMFALPPRRPHVIADVSDNLSRQSRPKFYAIVPGGFGEDVKAYVDRPHEWNGVDESGLPPELVGGDYIRPFIDDRYRQEIEIAVTLNGPANVYVLYDQRVPIPDWLSSAFEVTSLEVGLDEGDFYNRWKKSMMRQALAVGAGKSIDTRYAVWKRTVRDDLKVVLGPTLPRPNGLHLGFSMYGVVAVPLSAGDAP